MKYLTVEEGERYLELTKLIESLPLEQTEHLIEELDDLKELAYSRLDEELAAKAKSDKWVVPTTKAYSSGELPISYKRLRKDIEHPERMTGVRKVSRDKYSVLVKRAGIVKRTKPTTNPKQAHFDAVRIKIDYEKSIATTFEQLEILEELSSMLSEQEKLI